MVKHYQRMQHAAVIPRMHATNQQQQQCKVHTLPSIWSDPPLGNTGTSAARAPSGPNKRKHTSDQACDAARNQPIASSNAMQNNATQNNSKLQRAPAAPHVQARCNHIMCKYSSTSWGCKQQKQGRFVDPEDPENA